MENIILILIGALSAFFALFCGYIFLSERKICKEIDCVTELGKQAEMWRDRFLAERARREREAELNRVRKLEVQDVWYRAYQNTLDELIDARATIKQQQTIIEDMLPDPDESSKTSGTIRISRDKAGRFAKTKIAG